MSARVAVSGANGFIGRAVCAAALQRGCAVTGIVRRAAALDVLPAGTAPLLIVDDAQDAAPQAQLPVGDCLIHTAGRSHALHGEHLEAAYRSANLEAPLRLARAAAARGYRRFVFVSSSSVLGAQDQITPYTEQAPPVPYGPYATTKLEAEQELFGIGRATGMEVVVLRPPMVYGPGSLGNFSRLMGWVRSGWPIPLGMVHNARSYVYVDNLADAALTCALHPGAANRMFLVADGQDWSTPQMVRMIARAMGRPARLWPMPVGLLRSLARACGKAREIGSLTESRRIDAALLRRLTGWAPPVATEEAVARTVRWFLDRERQV